MTNLRPVTFHGLVALGITLALTILVLLAFRPSLALWPYLGAWLLAVSLTTFGYYGYDKHCARQGWRRVPERVLHGLAIAGGSLGAYAGMVTFRHKTIKGPFRLVFWTVVVVQVLLIAALAYRLLFL